MGINFQGANSATRAAVKRNAEMRTVFQKFHHVLRDCLADANFAALVTSISEIDRRDSFDVESSLGYMARFRYTPGTGEHALRGKVLVVVWRLGDDDDNGGEPIRISDFTFDGGGVSDISAAEHGLADLGDGLSAMYIVQTTFLETLAT